MSKSIPFKSRAICAFVSTIVLLSCSKDNTTMPDQDKSLNKYVTKLFEYVPAPGQFINESLGNEDAAKSILGNDEGMVSLGAFGGYIVLGFDHHVVNKPDEEDFVIYGNALDVYAEPGVVWVMQDQNGNGLPDDTWYEIKGSEYGNPRYDRNYSLTYYKPSNLQDDIAWKDNSGREGVIKRNEQHQQDYFPAWINKNSYTLMGTLLPNSNIDKTSPALTVSLPFEGGYADNHVGGDKIDITNAIDEDGNIVDLDAIDFIKIQTGVLADLGLLGEFSTEVRAVADLNLP